MQRGQVKKQGQEVQHERALTRDLCTSDVSSVNESYYGNLPWVAASMPAAHDFATTSRESTLPAGG